MPPKDIERVDDLVKKSEVTEAKTEPESVALQRLKNEGKAYFLVVSIAGAIFIVVLLALVYALFKEGISDDTKAKIVTGLIVAISASGGVLAGKKL